MFDDVQPYSPDPTHRVERQALPCDLESMEPDLFLAAIVSSIDRSRLSDEDSVRLLAARERIVSHLQAERAADIAEVAHRSDPAGEFGAFEVAAALNLTSTAARQEVAFAMEMTERLPQVHRMLTDGRIDVRRARVFADATCHLPGETARQIVAAVADRAPDMTTGQLRALIRKECISVDPADAAKRIERSVEQRRVVLEATPAGTANLLLLDLSPDVAMAAWERIDATTRMLPADGRSADQRRTDVAVDLLCGQAGASRTGMVDITVDLQTLLGLAEAPGELGAWGPVVAEIARRVVHRQTTGRWQATVIDDDGAPLAVAVRRRPTASQSRQTRARNPRCIFPGCRRPARRSDIDHNIRFVDGGLTLERNLAPLCRSHHRAKDEGGWRYRRTADGTHCWTSPLGCTYTTRGRSP